MTADFQRASQCSLWNPTMCYGMVAQDASTFSKRFCRIDDTMLTSEWFAHWRAIRETYGCIWRNRDGNQSTRHNNNNNVKFLRCSDLVRCLWHLTMLQTNPTTDYCFYHSHQLQPFQHLVTSNEKGQSGSGAHTVKKKMPLEPFCHDSIEHSGYTEDEQLRQGGVWKSASVPRVPERPVASLQLQAL